MAMQSTIYAISAPLRFTDHKVVNGLLRPELTVPEVSMSLVTLRINTALLVISRVVHRVCQQLFSITDK